MGGQDTVAKQERSPPRFKLTQVTRSASGGPGFLRVTQEEPCGLLGSELATLGGGGLGTSTALVSSHISVFPSLPLQDLCEVGP